MILPDKIIKSTRKTLSLTIKQDGEIIVHAPNKMKDEQINSFLQNKQAWLIKKLSQMKQNQDNHSEIIHYQQVLFLGKTYTIKLADVKSVEFMNDLLLVPRKLEQSKVIPAVINFYKKKAKEILIKRLDYLQSIMKIKSGSVKISNSKGRWGSCNSNGVITLNWRVLMLSPACVDYVIVHELCHLIEMNHSKRFWNLVSTFLPNFENQRATIKQFGFLLNLYR